MAKGPQGCLFSLYDRNERTWRFCKSISQNGQLCGGLIWDECVATFSISEKMYTLLFIGCSSWLDLKLQHDKETLDFPDVTKGYVKWIVTDKYTYGQRAIGLSILTI